VGDPRGGRITNCGYVDKESLNVLKNRTTEHLVEVVAHNSTASIRELIRRMPTPRGPFWTHKTFACSFGGVVARYKDAGMGWSTFFCDEEVREKAMRKAIGIDPDLKRLYLLPCGSRRKPDGTESEQEQRKGC